MKLDLAASQIYQTLKVAKKAFGNSVNFTYETGLTHIQKQLSLSIWLINSFGTSIDNSWYIQKLTH